MKNYIVWDDVDPNIKVDVTTPSAQEVLARLRKMLEEDPGANAGVVTIKCPRGKLRDL